MTLAELEKLPKGTLVKYVSGSRELFGVIERAGHYPIIRYEDGKEGTPYADWQASWLQVSR